MMKFISRILLLAVLSIGVIWLVISPAQRKWILLQADLWHPETQILVEQNPALTGMNEVVASIRKEIPREWTESWTPQDIACLQPETKPVEKQTNSSVYSWVDESGRRHFSDKAPEKTNTEDLTQRYGSKEQYFSFSMQSPDGGIPPFMQDRLRADVEAIYHYLSQHLSLDHLRQVELNMTVFGKQTNFDNYLAKHAPGLNTNSGFYSALTNEAVVMQQRDNDWTLRIARHESTHVIVAGMYGLTPLWFNEGLAEYFADYSSQALSRGWRIPRWRVDHLKKLEAEGRLPDLKEYMRMPAQQWRNEGQKTMYAMAWSIIYFLLKTEAGLPVMQKLMVHFTENPCSNIDAVKWTDKHFPGGWSKFEETWREWLINRAKIS